MADNVSLSASVRTSLLSLQRTTDLIERTQNRLSTGLKVAGPTDDPVAYFQAKGLSDRADDFTQKKDGIDQGVSAVSSALDAVDAIESLVKQLKGVAQSMKSATGSQFGDLVTQFNSLRGQISNLTADATYQGTNLVNGTTARLQVEFSEKSGSLLTINSVNLTETGLNIGQAVSYTSNVANAGTGGLLVNFDELSSFTLEDTNTSLTLTYRGPDVTLDDDGTYNFEMNGDSTAQDIALRAATGETYTLTAGSTITVTYLTAGATDTTGAILMGTGAGSYAATAATFGHVSAEKTNYVSQGDTIALNAMINQLDQALTTLRTQAQTLGSNVALLQTRLDFTQNYVNTLVEGSGKLTLADINEEGANLLALQTRQQLGINSLSFAGQAEQSILSLFR